MDSSILTSTVDYLSDHKLSDNSGHPTFYSVPFNVARIIRVGVYFLIVKFVEIRPVFVMSFITVEVVTRNGIEFARTIDLDHINKNVQ